MTRRSSANPSVLLVEDDENDERLAARIIGRVRTGLDLQVVRDGQEALDRLLAPKTTSQDMPDLVLLDVKLPRLTGYEVLERIRADDRTCLLPVVVFTSSDEATDQLRCYRAGVNSYVQKPVDFTEFGRVLEEILDYWLDVNLGVA